MTTTSFRITILALIATCSLNISAQITGLWEITGVSVGDQNMTPIAKWTAIHEDGTFENGNGWLQNSKGIYTYDAEANTYFADDSLGFDDPYGPFTVEIAGNEMTWQRTEDGMEVTVNLKRINEKPKAPADKIYGAWDLVRAELGDNIITDDMDPNDEVSMLMRWDRIFVSMEPGGKRVTGYWIINAHRPELTLVHHDKEKADGRWTVSFKDDQMIWDEISDNEAPMRYTFQRMGSFPKN